MGEASIWIELNLSVLSRKTSFIVIVLIVGGRDTRIRIEIEVKDVLIDINDVSQEYTIFLGMLMTDSFSWPVLITRMSTRVNHSWGDVNEGLGR